MPTEEQELEFIAEELRTNTAGLPRGIVERYVTIKDDEGELRKFLMLLLDMSFDGSLDAHLPASQEESTAPLFDDGEEEEYRAWQLKMYAETNEEIITFLRLEEHAKALVILKAKGE